MFRNTIAVGPLDPTAFWVTGGTTGVAKVLDWRILLDSAGVSGAGVLASTELAALRDNCSIDGLIDMVLEFVTSYVFTIEAQVNTDLQCVKGNCKTVNVVRFGAKSSDKSN